MATIHTRLRVTADGMIASLGTPLPVGDHDAVVTVDERLADTGERPLHGEALVRKLTEISARCAARPVVDHRTVDEILGYDEHGGFPLMVIDTSALLAILFWEPEREMFIAAMATAPDLPDQFRLDARNEHRAGKPAGGAQGRADLEELLAVARVEVVPFAPEHLAQAQEAWRKYGKGRHPAALNLGDCCAYGTAKQLNEPLLFKGKDFALTDMMSAV